MNLSEVGLEKNYFFTGRGSTAIYVLLTSIQCDQKKILVPSNICEVVIAVIKLANFKPVYVDVDPISGNAEQKHFSEAYTDNECVALAVPNFGSTLNIEAIRTWCTEKNIFLIADLCNAIGVRWNNDIISEYADASIYSFGYAKTIEFGIGGALSITDQNLYKACLENYHELRFHDILVEQAERKLNSELFQLRNNVDIDKPTYYVPLYEDFAPNLVFRLTSEQTTKLEAFIKAHDFGANIAHRNKVVDIYREIKNENLEHRPINDGDIIWRYTLLCKNAYIRNQLIEDLRKNSFLVSSWYPCVADFFETIDSQNNLPGAKAFEEKVLNLFVDERVSLQTARSIRLFLNQYTL